MSLDFEALYSKNAQNLKKSVIRELLKLTNKPEIISFAGGLPAPCTFPVEDIKEIVGKVLDQEYMKALQYGATEGDVGLKEELVKFLKERNIPWITPDHLLITTASQQALDMVGKVFIDPGDSVIVGLPSYIGALGAFNAYRANLIGIPLLLDGMDVAYFKKTLKELNLKKKIPKFVYVIPDFQNPAGITFSLKTRKELLSLAHEYGFIIIEDAPYRELRYNGKAVPSLLELDKGEGMVLTLFTFSKIFIPGFRLGWIAGHPDLISKFVIAKQSMDLCTPPFTQCIAREYLKKGEINNRIRDNIALYKVKKDLMLECLDKEMPKNAGVTWTKPEGGLFLFTYLPESISADEMFHDAIKENVAYVIGSAFYCNGKGHNTFRLNFSYPSHQEIREGIKRLGNCVKKKLTGTKRSASACQGD
ncbi:MAG: PLP-dependent aminotransferase family protein [Candidatus Wallbacteria bacterium]|nr:PLP-dependent aminotransferase family protein [Candidatus Wallbacteria bacterium]